MKSRTPSFRPTLESLEGRRLLSRTSFVFQYLGSPTNVALQTESTAPASTDTSTTSSQVTFSPLVRTIPDMIPLLPGEAPTVPVSRQTDPGGLVPGMSIVATHASDPGLALGSSWLFTPPHSPISSTVLVPSYLSSPQGLSLNV